ncbi:MAG: Radical domain protein [Firmicutes bacterium]|nr:Radical domain protein [Bacillota bacterium]
MLNLKLYIIPMFIPHYGCPNQCVFCDQRAITGVRRPVTANDVAETIERHLAGINRPYRIEVAFYGGSFTALPPKLQMELLAPAKAAFDHGKIQAIRLSTRPDSIDDETAIRLKNHSVGTVELGAQSMDDKVLLAAKRGHSADDVKAARTVLRKFAINCGIQLMPGLPNEDWLSLIRTGRQVAQLQPEFVRIYPTVVIPNTPLAALYRQRKYEPLNLQQAITRSAYLKLLFEQKGITVIRTGLQATEGLSKPGNVLAGAYHPAFGEMVEAFIYNLMVIRILEGLELKASERLIIHHHTKDTSKLRGIYNSNLKVWQQNYPVKEYFLIPDGVRQGELVIKYCGLTMIINKYMLLT